MESYFYQGMYDIRCEWGSTGLVHLAPNSNAVVIVDVFSFTTAVDIVLGRNGRVYPYRWRDERAQTFSQEVGVILADGGRSDPHAFSLSPASLRRLPSGASVVLPSPNGAALSLEAGSTTAFAGCLRNARAVALAAARIGRRISVVPAGEKWPDGGLRPALEDWLGAGAILSYLPGSRSPEAETA